MLNIYFENTLSHYLKLFPKIIIVNSLGSKLFHKFTHVYFLYLHIHGFGIYLILMGSYYRYL